MFNIINKYEHCRELILDLKLPAGQSHVHCFPKKRDPENARCISIQPAAVGHNLFLSYYIGIDWIVEKEQAIYVEPKLNRESPQTDYLAMLVKALKHPGTSQFTNELFEIKLDSPFIEIDHHQDLITPLIVIQYLSVLQSIVRKGLKKSFYKVENNLTGRIKGKILIGQTIKQNLFKNKTLKTFCQYDEFGYDSYENRLLKKALTFVQRYLPNLKFIGIDEYALNILDFVMPAFSSVNNEVDLNNIKQNKPNIFYKEYSEGIRLAKLILKRFGYNINNTQKSGKIKTPPFWIDMSKLFELYVLGLFYERFGSKELTYHFETNWQELDFLINTPNNQMVVDAKYRPIYKAHYHKEDIRQVSGYARMKSVYKALNKPENEIIDCLIIYPDQEHGHVNLKEVNLKEAAIDQFVNFYKVPISLPLIKIVSEVKEYDIVKSVF